MTTPQIQELHGKIETLVCEKRLKEAMSNLTMLLQQVGFGPLYDELRQQETTYRYLLQYSLEGYADRDRDKVLHELYRKLCDISDRAFLSWMRQNSCGWLFSRLRQSGVSSFTETARALQEALDDDEIAPDEASHKACRIRYEELQQKLFLDVLNPEPWKESDSWSEGFAMADNDTQALLTAALLLSLQVCFDSRKVLMLMELSVHSALRTSMRALVSLMLVLDRYGHRVSLCTDLTARLSLLLDDEKLVSQIYVILAALVRERNADHLDHRMKESILPEMNRFGSLLQKRMDKQEKTESELDMEELLSDTSLTGKMAKFQQMQTEGEDVYYATFHHLKKDAFFSVPGNWFLPYNDSHSEVAVLLGTWSKEKNTSPLRVISILPGICDSDKYTLFRSLSGMGNSPFGTFFHSGMQGGTLEDAMEDFKETTRGQQAFFMVNQFVQDLYRFCTLCPQGQEFGNVFDQSFDFFVNPLLSSSLSAPECRAEVASAYIRHPHYRMEKRRENCRKALRIYESMPLYLNGDFDALRLCGYCHEQLNELPKALECYRKADAIKADNKWVLRHLASCCSLLGQPEEACKAYQRLAVVDGKNVQHLLNVGHTLMELKHWSEALNTYYKAEFLFPDSKKTWRPLAWCSTLMGRYEQAETYTARILENEPRENDWLNAGHLSWLRGRRREAVERYVEGARMSAGFDVFLSTLDRDLPQLVEAGLDKSEIPMMRDSILEALGK